MKATVPLLGSGGDRRPIATLGAVLPLILKCLAWYILIFPVCFYFAEPIFWFLVEPLADVLKEKGGFNVERHRMIFVSTTELFFTYVTVAAYAAALLSWPVIQMQVWRFLARGPDRQARWAARPFLLAAPILFLLGAGLAYVVVAPATLGPVIDYDLYKAGDTPLWLFGQTVKEYLWLETKLIFAVALAAQFPAVVALLVRTGVLCAGWLAAKRVWAGLAVLAGAAVATAAHPVELILLAAPLALSYEVAVALAKRTARSRPEAEGGDHDDDRTAA